MKENSKPVGEEGRSEALWVVAQPLLAALGKEFFSNWQKVAKRFEEDDIHDLRVSSRRLREGLTLFAPCFPAKKTRRLAREVKGVTTMLGSLRNTDEACRFFAELGEEETADCRRDVQALLSALRHEREDAYAGLKKELGALDPAPLRARLSAIRKLPKLFGKGAVDPFMSSTFFAAGAITVRSQPVAELIPEALAEHNSIAQHHLRIAVKKLRYRLEIISPLLKSGYRELREALKGYQDVLGKLHDIDVFTDLVRERVEDGAGMQALLRVLAARRTRLFDSFLQMLAATPLDSIGERVKSAL